MKLRCVGRYKHNPVMNRADKMFMKHTVYKTGSTSCFIDGVMLQRKYETDLV